MKFKLKSMMTTLREMRAFLILWVTQAFSGLGSAVTSYALVVWSYTQAGSALATAGLMISSYAPYVLCSVFAGALSDRWDKRRTMLVCDAMAALTTLCTLLLLKTGIFSAAEFFHRISSPLSATATGASEPSYMLFNTLIVSQFISTVLSEKCVR